MCLVSISLHKYRAVVAVYTPPYCLNIYVVLGAALKRKFYMSFIISSFLLLILLNKKIINFCTQPNVGKFSLVTFLTGVTKTKHRQVSH